MKRIKNFLSFLLIPMKIFGKFVASVVNTLSISIVYVIGVGITFLLTKVFGIRVFQETGNRGTYWIDVEPQDEDMDAYYRHY